MTIPTKLKMYFSSLLRFHVENMHKFYHTNEISSCNFLLQLNTKLQFRICTDEKQYKHIKKAVH